MRFPARQDEPPELTDFAPELRARAHGLIGPKLRPLVASSDLLQETLLVAVKKFAAISGRSRREVLAWLNQIMRHRLLRYLRKHQRELTGQPVNSIAIEASSSSRRDLSRLVLEELRDEIVAAMDALPQPERTVVVGLYREKQTVAELATQLGKTDGAIRAIHQRAVKRLRVKLVEHAGKL
jgi:RNA polymerase sigma-70 factor (ECF subfamily)